MLCVLSTGVPGSPKSSSGPFTFHPENCPPAAFCLSQKLAEWCEQGLSNPYGVKNLL